MTESDENELHRLAAMLETIDGMLEIDSPLREGLKKAGFALIHVFTRGQRAEVERDFRQIARGLSDSERTHLHELGIDPEAV
jgi:hypothetical protein